MPTIVSVICGVVGLTATWAGEGAMIVAPPAKNRPVTKVITLLQDMQKQLEKEAEDDEAIYNKMSCWCETNDREKTESIQNAEAQIADLQTRVEEFTASGARLGQEIKNSEKEVAQNQQSLDQATAIRQKQLAAFNAEEKDLLQSVKALEAAIVILSKHHSSFAQVPHTHLLGIASTLHHEMHIHQNLLEGILTPRERRVVRAFIEQPQDYFDAAPTFKQSYSSQSGEIFGILKQMKETFEADLSTSQKEELANQKAYEELKSAKEAEISVGQEQVNTKTQEKASTDEKLVQAKEDIEDTKAALSADEQFLMMLKEKCQMTDKEWEERQKTRSTEIEAVSRAISLLSSDDAHDLFAKTFNPTFLQEMVETSANRRKLAASVLTAMAAKTANPALATLATKVRLDAFERVKAAIDSMVAQLTKDKADEIKHKDFCVDEFNTNQLQTERKEREKADFEAKIEDTQLSIAQLTSAINTLNTEIGEMQVQLKRAGEDRENQNKQFQSTVADQRETQKLLTAALSVLKEVYAKNSAALVQNGRQQPAGPPPPAGFDTYKKSEASGGVLSLLQQIISDAKAMEAETIRSEEDSQQAYEDFVKDTNASIEAKSREIVNKSETKARTEIDNVKAKESKESAMIELEQLSNHNSDLHSSCDFIIKNFDVRQTARDEEIEALKQAKAILSGADFNSFVQAATAMTDRH